MSESRVDRRAFISTVSSGIAAVVVGGGLDAMASPSPATKQRQSGTTGLVDDERYREHLISSSHPESPERLRTIGLYLEQTGLTALLTPLSGEVAAQEHILALHSQSHYASVMACSTTGEISQLAVSQVLGAADAIAQGHVRNAFCAIRPPGHHSRNLGGSYDGHCQGEGFCFFCNVAIAARYIQNVLGYRRVLIIDWDYHYGNGTYWALGADPNAMFYSSHNQFAYPGSGDPAITGEGDAVGHTVNVHLPAGAGDADIINAWDTVFVPRMQQIDFKPDFVLISAGFDSRVNDPLGRFEITDAAFVTLTQKAMAIAGEHCGGRLLSLLEGGYDVDGLGRAVCAHTATLAGLDWTGYIPARATPRRGAPAPRQPEIRQGILYLPDEDIGQIERVAIYDAAGRELYRVPNGDLLFPMVDLWPRALSAGMCTVLLRKRDGSVLRVPFFAAR